MANAPSTYSILLIDDKREVLVGLSKELSKLLSRDSADIRLWMPSVDDGDPEAKFAALVDKDTALVATDYDLTGKGLKGLFGTTIVGWCQQRFIPVGDFSRANKPVLPKEPNLFELRVPPTDIEGAQFIASAFHGFTGIRQWIAEKSELLKLKRGLAAVLAALLGRPHLDNQLALYMTRLGTANSALLQRVTEFTGDGIPDQNEKAQVLSYVLGHFLLNAVLKYPGPILSERALCAYMATSAIEAAALCKLFIDASYVGPFKENQRFFWREEVDKILDKLGAGMESAGLQMFGDYNRAVVERTLKRKLAAHDCARCGGRNGGFLCPFTERTVCQLPECSVSASSWIPQGAQLSRVERDFYDEWAPMLGL